MVRERIEFHAAHYNHRYKSDEEHQAACQTEEVHRLFTEFVQEPQRHKVQITVHKTVDTEL